jgi:hypothetical protein
MYVDPIIQAQLRHQALRIGLISKRTESCLRFCSEPEAAALHSFDRTQHLAKQVSWLLASYALLKYRLSDPMTIL